ncbi:MAG: hypothetical protein ACYC46_02155 [Acidobacteriaceae bacterium]
MEHKAQRHFEGLLSVSLFIAMVSDAAGVVHLVRIVPHVATAMYIAV